MFCLLHQKELVLQEVRGIPLYSHPDGSECEELNAFGVEEAVMTKLILTSLPTGISSPTLFALLKGNRTAQDFFWERLSKARDEELKAHLLGLIALVETSGAEEFLTSAWNAFGEVFQKNIEYLTKKEYDLQYQAVRRYPSGPLLPMQALSPSIADLKRHLQEKQRARIQNKLKQPLPGRKLSS